MTSVRLLTYNILGGKARVALRSVVRAVDPGVMVVNETPQAPGLWRLQCTTLARQWDLQHVAGGRSAGRNMILAAPHVGVAETHVQRHRQPRFQPIRGAVGAQLQVGSHRFGVVGCHLALGREARLAQVDQLLRMVELFEDPVVVAGDMNEPPQGPAWKRLREAGFVDHGDAADLTFPAEHPVKRIDAVLVRGDARVSRHRVPGVQPELLRLASDHLPVMATLTWP